jgi:hypothetical protein
LLGNPLAEGTRVSEERIVLTEEVCPFHFPALDLLIFSLGEAKTMRRALKLESNAI